MHQNYATGQTTLVLNLDFVIPQNHLVHAISQFVDPISPSCAIGFWICSATQVQRWCLWTNAWLSCSMEFAPKYYAVIVKRFIEFRKSDEGVFLLRNGEKTAYHELT